MPVKTHWDRPAHFIGSRDCRFGLSDAVGGVIVSTVGDYRPMHHQVGPYPIGANRTYETMVFRDSGKRCDEPSCGCGLPEPESWTEIDFAGYRSEAEARAGHAEMVAKYAAKVRS